MTAMMQGRASAYEVSYTLRGGSERERVPLPLGGQELSLAFPPGGAVVREARLWLEGAAYSGVRLIEDWQVTISAGAAAGQYILDFHRPLAIDQVTLSDGAQDVPLSVYPWLGVAFDETPVRGAVVAQKLQVGLPAESKLTEDQVLAGLKLLCRSYPSNVRMMVKGQPPFFFHPGELCGVVEVPDFSAELNRQLEAARAAGRTGEQLELVILSDMPGDLTVTTAPVCYSISLPARVGDTGEAAVNLDPGQPEGLPLLVQADGLPVSATLTGITLQIAGEMAGERMEAARIAAADRTGVAAVIFPMIAAAQPLDVSRDLTATGVQIKLAGDQDPAVLQVELRADDAGVPGAEPLTAGTVDVQGSAPAAWVEVRWTRPMALVRGAVYWLVVRASRGQAIWEAMPLAEPGLAYTRDDGLSWQAQGLPGGINAVGQFKLMYEPDVLQPAPALRIGLVADGEFVAEAQFTPSVAPQSVTLQAKAFEGGLQDLALWLEPAAAGRVHISAGLAEVTVGVQGSGSDG